MSSIDNIPSTMLAARVTEYGERPTLTSVPTPNPEPHQILVRCVVGGLCHTDLQTIDGENKAPMPLTIGHEPAGIIAALGSQVEGFHIGQRVGFMNPYNACGNCIECSNGDFMYCESEGFILGGVTTDGSFSQYALADARFTYVLDPAISFELGAPLMCAGVTTFNALKRANLPKNGTVAVIGCGGLGHLLVQFAVAAGYNVLGVDTRQCSLDLVEKLGCKSTILVKPDGNHSDLRKQAQNATGGLGADASIIVTDSHATIAVASAVTRRHGNVVLVGCPPKPWPIPVYDLLFRDLTYRGSLESTPEVCREMLDFVVKHNIEIHSTVYPFEKVAEMVDDYRSGKISGRLVLRIASDEELLN